MRPAVCVLLVALPLLLGCSRAPDTSAESSPPDSLRISENGRFIVSGEGAPFFYLADTAWELFHRLDRAEADRYLRDRAAKGFTVIQATVLAERKGLTTPNPYGDLPLQNMDPTRPNEAYFEHVDYVVDRAEQRGLYVGMLPTWGDKFNKKWGAGPEIFTPENARAYGRFLGNRYADDPIIWILGGDRNPETDRHRAIIRAMAQGLQEGDDSRPLMTYHPQGKSASAEWFHEDAWLDFNMFQSSHFARDWPNYQTTRRLYQLQPAKPVVDGEPRYEDLPVDFDPENGRFGAFDVRQAAYWSLLAGAAGHTYGNNNVWQMWAPEHEPAIAARTPWNEALDAPGAADMQHLKALFLSRPWLRLRPGDAVIEQPGEGAARKKAARATDRTYAFAYTPYGKPITTTRHALDGKRMRAWWYDPRDGSAEEIGAFATGRAHTFDPPGAARRGNDWVLVLDRADASYAAPGSTQRLD